MEYSYYTNGFLDIKAKIAYLIFGICLGITFFFGAHTKEYLPYYNSWQCYLCYFNVSDSFLEVVSGVMITIYALALPISISTVSEQLKPYKDEFLIGWITNRWEFFYIRVCLPLIIVYVLIFSFLNINNGFGMIITILFSSYTLLMTFRFFKSISELVFNTEITIIKWSSNSAKSLLK